MIKKVGILLSIIIMAIILILWINSMPSSNNISKSDYVEIASKDDVIPSKTEKLETLIEKVLKEGIIFCLDKNEAIVNGEIIKIDENNEDIKPIEQYQKETSATKVSEVYIPLEFLANKLQMPYKIQTTGEVTLNNKKIDKSDAKIENSVCYISANAIENATDKKYFRYGEIIIISSTQVIYNSEMIDYFKEQFNSSKYPVIANYYLDWEFVSGYNGEGVRYKVFTNGEEIGEVTATESLSSATDENYKYVEVTENIDDTKYKVQDKLVAIGNCDFNPYRRRATKINNKSDLYKEAKTLIKNMITEDGLDSNASIKEMYELDIDGEGNKSYIINATTEFQLGNEYYSYLILRKNTGEKFENIIIERTSTKTAEFDNYHDFSTIDILDVNNDGNLEMVVCDALFETYEIKIINLNTVK